VNERNFKEQQRRAVLTAWVLAAIAFLIFLWFVLSGVLGS